MTRTKHKKAITKTQRFKKNHPDYYKNYYKNNKDKFNKKQKKRWFGVEIYGTMYYFDKKSDIKIKILNADDIKRPNYVRIESN